MRALVVEPGPSFSVADVHRGWVNGLRQLGVEVIPYNLAARLEFYTSAHLKRDDEWLRAFEPGAATRLALLGVEAACYEWEPDVVVFISGFFLDDHVAETLRRHHKLVIVHTESPYEDDRQLRIAPLADLNVLNDPTNLDRFAEHGPAVYLPHCYDPDIHYPRPAVRGCESEFFFVGTGYPSRVEFFEQVDWTSITATLAGNWPSVGIDSPLYPLLCTPGDCMDNTDAVDWYVSTLTSCNLYRQEANDGCDAQGWAMGPREVELAACGTWFARQPRGESDELFPMLPTFTEPAELGELIRWAIAHPDERETAAVKAREAISARTFDVSAAAALTHLGF